MNADTDSRQKTTSGGSGFAFALEGPPGSGKSHFCRSFALDWIKSSKGCAIYLGIVCESGTSLARRGCDEWVREYLIWDGEGGEAKWTKSIGSLSKVIFDGASRELLAQRVSLWTRCFVTPEMVLLVFDDYDLIREKLESVDFAVLLTLLRSGVRFLGTSRRRLSEAEPREGESEFLAQLDMQRITLPSESSSVEIVRDRWQRVNGGAAHSKEPRVESPSPLSAKIESRIASIGGRYPGIVSCLANLTALQGAVVSANAMRGDRGVDVWLKNAQREGTFRAYLREMVGTLKPAEATGLSLVAIAEISGLPVAELLRRWSETPGSPRSRGLRKALQDLESRRLLIEDVGTELRIVSSALKEYVAETALVQRVADAIGVRRNVLVPSVKFDARRSMKLWLLGLLVFAAISLFDGGSARYLSWIPWVSYLAIYGWRRRAVDKRWNRGES